MSTESNSKAIIDAFFDALRLRDLDQCEAYLDSLEKLSHQQSSLKPWRVYIEGVLAFEAYRDWAKSERIFTELAQMDMELTLQGRVWHALGRSLDIQGRWAEAISAFEQSLAISAQLEQTLERRFRRRTVNNCRFCAGSV